MPIFYNICQKTLWYLANSDDDENLSFLGFGRSLYDYSHQYRKILWHFATYLHVCSCYVHYLIVLFYREACNNYHSDSVLFSESSEDLYLYLVHIRENRINSNVIIINHCAVFPGRSGT